MLTNFRQIIQYDEVLGHKYIPNQSACLQYGNRNYLIQTDKNGFRNTQRNIDGKLKIIVLGDSYSSGYGISNSERFTELLETQYNAKVTNLAVSGYGVDQQVLAYQEYAKSIEHDLVIFIPFLDDLARTCMKARSGFERSTGRKSLIPKPYFVLVLSLIHISEPTRPERSRMPSSA